MRRAIVIAMIGMMCACSGKPADANVGVTCDADDPLVGSCLCGGRVCPDAPGGTGHCTPDGCAIQCNPGYSMIHGVCEPPVQGLPQRLTRRVAYDNHECSSSVCSP